MAPMNKTFLIQNEVSSSVNRDILIYIDIKQFVTGEAATFKMQAQCDAHYSKFLEIYCR